MWQRGTLLWRFAQIAVRLCHDERGTAAGLSIAPDSVAVSISAAQPAHGLWTTSPPPFVAAAGNRAPWFLATKRLLDIVGATLLLIVLAPLLLIVLVVLLVTTRGRPIFAQERVGQCGQRFQMYKFRTMRLDADKLQHLVENEKGGPIFKNKTDPRITRLGRFMRKTSIDELPQLVNILAGDMSLVGPRPPVPKEVAQYKTWQRRRLAVKPGLTCLWQVSGRSDVGFDDWVRMDIWYVEHQSLATDLKLLARTPLSVISCKGAY